MRRILMTVTAVLLVATAKAAETRVEKNVVYGMHSGLALLLDVHRPDKPNGYGLVVIPGSGWQTTMAYDASSIKNGGSSLFVFVPPLLEAGYTLFVINHRAAPRFRYPAAVEDAQRAVRFVRFHANEYGINADRIGAVGYSSGAHLAALLGVLDWAGTPSDPDPINQVSARVQAVVGGATPTDLTRFDSGDGVPLVASFMGHVRLGARGASENAAEGKAYRAASPIAHLSRASAPLLLLHGDADEAVPFRQAELMVEAAQRAGAEVNMIRLRGGNHGFVRYLSDHPEWPDVLGETVHWFDRHLKAAAVRR